MHAPVVTASPLGYVVQRLCVCNLRLAAHVYMMTHAAELTAPETLITCGAHACLRRCFAAQEIEGVKAEMKALEARSKSMSEEAYNTESKQLLMKLYRVTGPAKVAAAKDHIAMLLEQGAPLACMHACAAGLTLP